MKKQTQKEVTSTETSSDSSSESAEKTTNKKKKQTTTPIPSSATVQSGQVIEKQGRHNPDKITAQKETGTTKATTTEKKTTESSDSTDTTSSDETGAKSKVVKVTVHEEPNKAKKVKPKVESTSSSSSKYSL